MDSCSNKSGWDKVKCIWQEYASLYIVPPMLTGLFIGLAIGFSIDNLAEFFKSLLPELVGIGITITGIYYLEQWRQAKVEETRLKKELLWQVTSRSQDVAVSAIDRIRHEGWLCGTNGILKGISASRAQWSGANISGANLEGAQLNFADLSNAILMGTNLSNASLYKANLSDSNLNSAILHKANLHNALLDQANIDMADFEQANLRDAIVTNIGTSNTIVRNVNMSKSILHQTDLKNSTILEWNFQSADIWGADFSSTQIWGTNMKNTKNIDQANFTNVTFKPHPNLNSPRYFINRDFDWTPYTNGNIYESYPEDWQIRVGLIENPYTRQNS